MADRRFALINKDISIDQIEEALDGDLTIAGDWTFEGDVTVEGSFTISTGAVLSGVYTPTITNGTNVAGSTAFQCQWMRVGNVVTVSGQVNIDPTLASTNTIINMTLPVATDLAAVQDLCGVGVNSAGPEVAMIRGATATDDARFDWVPTSTANTGIIFTFTYLI